jgi:ParB family chromosome partitioning protein
MNKRTDRIRSLFAQPPQPVLSADNTRGETARVPAGAVKAVKENFSQVERENEALRQELSERSVVREIDPGLIEPSPVADRFVSATDRAYEELRASIRDHGQEVPVLLRPHPARPGHFQISYGHRRVRAARDLGVRVRAIVRELSDDQLVVAQGLENAAREDLSFIERALFAERLEAQGFARTVIQQALAIDRAEASKLIAVARAIPSDIVQSIGKAPRVGRGRWQELAEVLADAACLARGRGAIRGEGFDALPSDQRFVAVLARVRRAETGPMPGPQAIVARDGRTIARLRRTQRGAVFSLDPALDADFGAFLQERLPALYEEFGATAASR